MVSLFYCSKIVYSMVQSIQNRLLGRRFSSTGIDESSTPADYSWGRRIEGYERGVDDNSSATPTEFFLPLL